MGLDVIVLLVVVVGFGVVIGGVIERGGVVVEAVVRAVAGPVVVQVVSTVRAALARTLLQKYAVYRVLPARRIYVPQ